MKKIIPLVASMMLILVVGIFAGAVTVAYFNDTETSSGNTLTAGTLDLKVDGKDNPDIVHITVGNIAPGWSATYNWNLQNTGSLPGVLSITVSPIVNYENGQNEPEALVDPTSGVLEGELGASIIVSKLNIYGTGNRATRLNIGSPDGPQFAHGAHNLNYLGGLTLYVPTGSNLRVLEPGEVQQYCLVLSLPGTVGNEIQSDSVQFDITFRLDQVVP
jgi:predicted ribosomally synthesized peptide with SipW-like signal peptide